MRSCICCHTPTNHFVTASGTAYGDPKLAPPAKRRGRHSRWGVRLLDKAPERGFEVRIPICSRCDGFRISLSALRGKARLPSWMRTITICIVTSLALGVAYISYQVGASWFWSLIIAVVAWAFTFVQVRSVMESIDRALRKPDHQKHEEAERISAAFQTTSEKLLERRGAEVEAELKREQQERLTTLENLQALGGHRFEELVTRLFIKMGYSAHKTRGSADGGIDIVAERGGEKILVQCKNYKQAIGPSAVRDLYGVVTSWKADKGILICTSTFSESARVFAEGTRIDLLDGESVVDMIKKYDLNS